MGNSTDMMKQSLTSADAGASWLPWIVGALVLAAVFFFVVLPLWRKLKRKQLKVKETSEIKKDLMIWHHLAQLVRGGNEHQKAKQQLSDQIVKINMLFKQGLKLLETHSRKLYEQPWFLIVGEPHSGKSTLLRNSEQELVVSVEEESDGEEVKSLPLRLWLGAKSVVCDVNGHVFFDRWLNGSSAEWNYIGKLLNRKRFKKPLDGLIVTIPADALLADDEALTQQKAILMTTEIGQLLHTIGMHLPCYVVVTKTDMINGFSEYVMGINDDLRSQIFGWVNDTPARYSAEKFKTFWDGLIDRLRAGCEKSMLSRNVATKLSAMDNRMEITGKIYLFPDNFDKLYQNLSVYLRALFGEGNFHGADNAALEGVFFTSAKDGDVTLSPSYAELCSRPVDEAPIPVEQKGVSHPYFIRDLLRKVVFRVSPNAFFTKKAQIKRNIPKYLLCLAMLTVGTIWLTAAYFKAGKLEAMLASSTEYYSSLSSLLQRGGVFDSPLIKKTADGSYVLNNDPVQGESMSRLQLFFEAFSERETENVAPFGFKTASLFVFGADKDMGYDDKAFIFNQMQAIMVRMPVIKSTGEKIISQGKDAPLTSNKREVIEAFSLLDSVENEDFTALFANSGFRLKPMINYLIPDVPGDTMSLLNSFLTRYDRKYTMTMDPAYIHSSQYFAAQRMGLDTILSAWSKLDAYPQTTYSGIKRAVDLSFRLQDTQKQLDERVERLATLSTVEQLIDTVSEWNGLVEQEAEQTEEMGRLLQRIQIANPLKKEKSNAAFGMWGSGVSLDALLRYAARDYRKLFESDFDFIDGEVKNFPIQPQDMNALRDAIESRRKSAGDKLTRETADLRKKIDGLKDAPLFRWQFIEKSDASGYMFRILDKLYTVAVSLKAPDAAELENGDFKSNWLKTQRAIKETLERYDAAVKPYAENEEIAKKAADIRKMLLANADLVRITVLDSELNKLPTSEAETYSMVEQNAGEVPVFDFSRLLAQEVVGDLRYAGGYNPETVKNMFENVFSIARPFMKNKQFGPQEILPASFMREYNRYDERLEVFEKYMDSFLRYWGTYPDNVYVPASSWAEFKQRLETLKAFKINSLLQAVYARCLSILKGIDDTYLSEALKAEKADYVAAVNDELSLLTPLFTDAGQKTLDAWASLPDDAAKAWEVLTALSDRELKNSFFNVYSTAIRGKIGWWNGFVDNGVALLRSENERMLETGYQTVLQDMNAFPLCKNCAGKKTITPKEMQKLAKLLQSVAPEAENETAEGALIDKRLDLFKNREALAWAGDILKVAALLADAKKPLIWTLYQAPVDLQNSLLSRGQVAAANRFRAVGLRMGNDKVEKRISSIMTADAKIGQGKASAPITLNFYKLTGDEQPEAQIRLGDYWAIFRIYLKNGGHIDPSNGQLYIPLTVKDKTGAKFVYFVTVKFNRDIFTPDEWPTKQDWKQTVSE